MTNNEVADPAAARTADRLAQAREVYSWVFKALQTSLRSLEDGEDSITESKQRQDLFRQHSKQLQAVFELEGSLDAYGNTTGAGSIDLDAARDEIRQRLARIRERRGS